MKHAPKLEELKAALEAATKGEWDYAVINNDCPIRSLVVNQYGDELLRHKQGVSGQAQRDALFIALAHNLMPTLLEAVALLQLGCEYPSPLPPEFVAKVERLLENLK